MDLTNSTMMDDASVLRAYRDIRQASPALCASLEIDDYGLQAMPEVSPPKWHLAHTSWFFEVFILKPFVDGYQPFHPDYEYLFNSYYHGVGAQYPRARRGLLSRPTVGEVLDYRSYIDAAMTDLLGQVDHAQRETLLKRCELGLHHEQQHQELLCTDIKYSFSFNPLYPSLGRARPATPAAGHRVLDFTDFEPMDAVIGCGGKPFHFDIEAPAHRFHLPAYRLANRLITNAEYQAFIQDGGYTSPELWLADGWLWKEASAAEHPRYWVRQDGDWFEYTLYGLCLLDPELPVSHVNYYEADACARWFGKRLPSEEEWEAACREAQRVPGYADIMLHPRAAGAGDGLVQMFGSLWQWTRSSFSPYPGFRPAAGAIGEYNGKFMCNQLVLRGSSCITPPGHARASYRNFFYPKDQWQFTGIRLADDV